MRYAAIITGSRVLEKIGRDLAAAEVRHVLLEAKKKGVTVLHRGDAPGIDSMPNDFEEELGFKVYTYCLDGTIRDKKDGEITSRWISEDCLSKIQDRRQFPLTRNSAMVAAAATYEKVRCYAFEAMFAQTKGTAQTYKTAMQYGISVYRVTFENGREGVKVGKREDLAQPKTPFARKLTSA